MSTVVDTGSTCAWLHEEASPIWEACCQHPIVQGIGSGETPIENFLYFMRQDYVYLIEFSRLFAYAGIKSPDLVSLTAFASFMSNTLDVEMGLHRSFCAKFGLSPQDLESTEPSPTTLSYTSYLLRVAQSGTLADILAGVLPCFWGYLEIGERLAGSGMTQTQPLYAEWIQQYIAPEYAKFCAWLRATFDRLTADAPQSDRERYRQIFLYGSRYEYLFWEAARTMEEWPV